MDFIFCIVGQSKDRPLGLGYFFSSLSFLGWHFSQTLPSLAALTQHLWSHFFPASTVASQHGFLSSAAWTAETLRRANAQTARDNNLMDFIFFIFGQSKDRPLGLGYFFSSLSFLGWHFSQTLPSLAALTQHLWSHFFPASTVASQHGFLSSAAWTAETLRRANAQTARDNNLMAFIFFIFGLSKDRPLGLGY